ncbi:MAG: S49 family peptidase [Thiothrix sp.]|nr:S49 family peptidase [Thiothrix sp.]HPQ94440.1 S49 family peptidase [Thiolinea sp.]
MNEESKAIEALKEIALEGIREQRRARRWGIFFKLMLAAYLLFSLIMVSGLLNRSGLDSTGSSSSTHTAVIDINGVIMEGAPASADLLVPSLRRAFADKHTKGIILRINSPGGSPVQAGYVNDEIRRLKKEHSDIPVYAVVADLCASGGYYIAVAADRIYADKASIVGSIGVRMDNFGFVGALQKLGVERRLYTAGTNKGMLDPFLPENPEQVDHVRHMLEVTHQQFIQVVREGRGDRLKETPDMFSGLFWTGETAVSLGLVDGLGSAGYVARELIGEENLVNFTTEKDFWQRLSDRIGTRVQSLMLQQSDPRPLLF